MNYEAQTGAYLGMTKLEVGRRDVSALQFDGTTARVTGQTGRWQSEQGPLTRTGTGSRGPGPRGRRWLREAK